MFVLATANDVEGLPPELLGRFDRTFFLDLPSPAERREIFAIHLKKAGEPYPERRFDLAELADCARGFVGREIERRLGRPVGERTLKPEYRQEEGGEMEREMEREPEQEGGT